MVEIISGDLVCRALVANIIETIITCTVNAPQMMIRNKEMLLPSHEYKVLVIKIISKAILVERFQIRLKCWKPFLFWS
jgi:hypothetical protein